MAARSIVAVAALAAVVAASGCGVPVAPQAVRDAARSRGTVVVYPVHVLSGASHFEATLALQIVEHLHQCGLRASVAARDPGVNTAWGVNEARMFRRSFDAFSATVREDLAADDLGLLVELLQSSREIDVHFFLLSRDGLAVETGLVNSHHPAHRAVRPATVESGLDLFYRVFGTRQASGPCVRK
jgi:hypothetical protein